ncbi:MAG TPA: DMT family transporter [Stellaceae bacterium]|nr:DMT family transporter [Stellaceae bacterium]
MSPTHATDHARPIVPFAVATGAILLLTTMDAVVKAMPLGLPIVQIVAMRYLFGVPLALLAMWRTRAGWPTLSSWKANAPRGVLNVVSLMLFFTALRRLPFAETLTLSYLAPLMLVLLASLLLGERLRARVLGAVLLGLVGVGVIAWDTLSDAQSLSADLIGIAAVSGSAVAYALNNVMLRSQARRDAATSIVLIQHVVPSLVALPFAVATWQAPSASIWLVFPLVAALGVSGHFLLTWAYRRAQAGVLASVDYLALPYGALLGFVFFAEVPTMAVWAGAALIVAACLIITGLRK